jgi:hypothetical protein
VGSTRKKGRLGRYNPNFDQPLRGRGARRGRGHKSQPPKPVDLRRRASVERNEGAGELDEGEIVLGFALPADEKTAVSVVPAVGALDDPASRFSVNTAEQRLLASPTDVGNDSTPTYLLLAVGIVVAFVEAQVLGAPWATRDHGIQGLAHHPLIVNVRAGDRNRQRHAVGVGQDVALGAEPGTIGRVGAGEVPPFGALTLALSSEHQLRSTPTCWS